MSEAEQFLQNLAAESDPRTTAIDGRWWGHISDNTATLDKHFAWALEDLGRDGEEAIRVTFAVCPLCEGRGRHVNPSIDAHGLTREDFDEDPDFEESYFRGDYDQECNLCWGEKVVPVPDEQAVTDAMIDVIRDRYEMRAEQLAEMRMGA